MEKSLDTSGAVGPPGVGDVSSGNTSDVVCAFCGVSLSSAACVVCTRCRTPHHLDCWHYNRGCCLYGCGSRSCEKAAPDDGRGSESVSALPEALRFDRYITGLFVLSYLFVSVYNLLFSQAGSFVCFSVPGILFSLFVAFLLRVWILVPYLIIDASTGEVRRVSRFLRWDIGAPAPVARLRPDNVSEVHLLSFSSSGRPVEELRYLDRAGRSHALYRNTDVCSIRSLTPDELATAAQRLADCLDAPVRLFPSPAGLERWILRFRILQILGLAAKPSRSPRPGGEIAKSSLSTHKAVPDGKPGLVKKKEAVRKRPCPACGGILTMPVTECSACGVLVHERCWEAARGCPLEGCNSRLGIPFSQAVPATADFILSPAPNPYFIFEPKIVALFLLMFIVPALLPGGRWVYSTGSSIFLIILIYYLVRDLCIRRIYRFCPESGLVDCEYTLFFLTLYRSVRPEMSARNIVEVYYEIHPGWLIRTEELSLGLRDGSRVVVYRVVPPVSWLSLFYPNFGSFELRDYADRLAAFADCTVRVIHSSGEMPSRNEIKQLAGFQNPDGERKI